MTVTETLKSIGDYASGITAKVLELVPQEILSSATTAKILSILIYSSIIWAVLHFANSIRPIVKYAIIILFVLLIVSIIFTFSA